MCCTAEAKNCITLKWTLDGCSIRVIYHMLHDLLYRARVKELLAVDAAVTSAPQSKPQPQEEEEEGYYSSYTHFGIHEEMLKVWINPLMSLPTCKSMWYRTR